MAKALYGYMATPDERLRAEVSRLRGRVRELEAQVQRLEIERALDLTTLDADLDLDHKLLEPVAH